MAEISIVCTRTVVSSLPVEPNKFFSLSCLDHMMEHNNLRMVYYYQFPYEGKVELGNPTRKLSASLSETLTSFPIVTGRLQKTPEGLWRIKCNDAGVRMIEARARGSVEEWIQVADSEQELRLVYWEEMFHKPYFWSTFYVQSGKLELVLLMPILLDCVQLTEFEGGGIAIGLSCSHLLADSTSATMLIKAWAETHSFRKMLTPPHFSPLPSRSISNKDTNRKPNVDLINSCKSSIETPSEAAISSSAKRHATVTFAFSDEMVSKCMAEAEARGDTITEMSSSPFNALAALFWLSISKVKGMNSRLVNLLICLDARKALELEKGFFGNCMVYNRVCLGPELNEAGLVDAAKAIESAVKKMEEKEIIMDWIDGLESKKVGVVDSFTNGSDLVCANWESLDPYSATFESGRQPIRVSYHVQPVLREGHVLILPSTEGDGPLCRVVMVTLVEEEAIRLCKEPFINHFSPNILMGVKENQD
ncbi:hypothetical protein Sjap_019124 [Stephania japonica]|uniref:Uncharacterized protein n=1 Tax=Stephania japonica TaxID=461633 RepID=A0AAP0F0Y9_9MAGN